MSNTQEDRLIVRCSCGAKLSAPPFAAGHSITCPKCRSKVNVPGESNAANDASQDTEVPAGRTTASGASATSTGILSDTATAGRFNKYCECGVRLRLREVDIGRNGRCPKCGRTFVIRPDEEEPPRTPPSDEKAPAPASAEAPMLDTSEDELDELLLDVSVGAVAASADVSAAPGAPVAGGAILQCPSCHARLSPGARLCTQCGYDLPTGQRRTMASAKQAVGALASAARTMGPFALGVVLSGVGALIGAGIWFAVAMITGYELGYIALAVGALSGLGMAIGYRDETAHGGVVAAGMAAGGIVVAKLLIFGFVIYAMLTGNTNNVDLQRALLIGKRTEEILDERGVKNESDRQKQWDTASAEAKREIDRLSDSQVRERFAGQYDAGDAEAFLQRDEAITTLAEHHATRKARADGLAYADPRWEGLEQKERRRFEKLTDAQLDNAVAEWQAWEQGGKWEDAAYVRDALIYTKIDEELTRREQEAVGKTERAAVRAIRGQAWQQLYDEIAEKVDAMSPNQRLAAAKSAEAAPVEAGIEDASADEEELADFDEEMPSAGEAARSVASLFFHTMFRGLDILFFFLAIAAAYRMASGMRSSN